MSKAEYVKSQGQTRKHHCHWPGCEKQVPPAMWGCSGHWFKLPAALRDKVWATYRPGQEIDGTPSAAYVEVAKQVQVWIKGQQVAAEQASGLAPEQAASWIALPYSTPIDLWRAFRGGAKFVLHYHGKSYEVTRLEPREKVVYVSPPGMPVKVYPNGRSAEGDNGTIWLQQKVDSQVAATPECACAPGACQDNNACI